MTLKRSVTSHKDTIGGDAKHHKKEIIVKKIDIIDTVGDINEKT